MAQSKLIDLALLTTYDEKIKALMSTEDAKSLKTISYNSSTRVVSFFKTEDGSGTAAYTVTLPDTSTLIPKLTMAAAGDPGNHAGDFVVLDSNGALSGAGATIASSKITGLGTAAAADVATSAIIEGSTDDDLVSAAQVATFVAAEIAGLTGAMHFIGVITRQTGETDAQAIARVVPDPESGDVVVMSDNAKEYVYDGTAWREVGDETEFVKKTTTIAGVDLEDNITKTELLTALNVEDGAQENDIEEVQVNGVALTPSSKAVNVTVAEGSTDGTIAVNGSDVAVHGLGSAAFAETTDFEAAGAVSTAIAALDASVSQSAGADGLALSVTEVDGVITAISGSIAAETYDAYGSAASEAAAAIATLDSNTSSATDTTDSGRVVLTEVGIVDGLIATKKSHTFGTAADCADTDFLKTADYTMATTADINALFD